MIYIECLHYSSKSLHLDRRTSNRQRESNRYGAVVYFQEKLNYIQATKSLRGRHITLRLIGKTDGEKQDEEQRFTSFLVLCLLRRYTRYLFYSIHQQELCFSMHRIVLQNIR